MTVGAVGRPGGRGTQTYATAKRPARAALSDLDHDILDIVCRLRVVTQTQLERLHADVPGRSVRYRTKRLHGLGLLGRTRPYRDAGSAPHHLWPTSRADALVRAQPPPRRGERPAPNPLFLAHAAALSELYVVLRTRAGEVGLELVRFHREGEARNDFRDTTGRPRAIAPDARIALRDQRGTELVAHVELDLATMAHRRLRAKLDGYFAHAESLTRGQGASMPPTLLFLTTSEQRAEGFLRTTQALRESPRWRSVAGSLLVAAAATSRHIGGSLGRPCWRQASGDQPVTLRECLYARPDALEAPRASAEGPTAP
jgi:hypothetical protein